MLPGEAISAISAIAEDPQQNIHQIPVEFIGRVPNFDWLSQLVLRLPDDIMSAEYIRISMSLHGRSSNRVTVTLRSLEVVANPDSD